MVKLSAISGPVGLIFLFRAATAAQSLHFTAAADAAPRCYLSLGAETERKSTEGHEEGRRVEWEEERKTQEDGESRLHGNGPDRKSVV